MKKAAKPFEQKKIPAPFALCGAPTTAGVLLAFSGGADSSALLHVLHEQSKTYGFSLTLLHVNHGIRGEEADRDEAFCKEMASHYGHPIRVLRADVPALAKEHKCGIEEEARRLRYDFFLRTMEETGAKILVTAHHADDNLETVLFRLARGSSLRGLGGIAPMRTFGQGYLVRPLLAVTKEEILVYCKEHKIDFVEDSTNEELSYSRNFIRRELVPSLKRLFDHPEVRVFRMTEWLREDEAYLDGLAKEALKKETSKGLALCDLLALPAPVLRRTLCRFVAGKLKKEPDGNHLESLMELLEKGRGSVALFGKTTARIEAGYFNIHSEEASPEAIFPPFGVGVWSFDGVKICVEAGEQAIPNRKRGCVVACDPSHPLVWRCKLPGESILLRGHHRALRKCYREADIPPRLRERMPLLCNETEILFAPFVGQSDSNKPESAFLYTVTVDTTDA